jgi:hypothetical protein
MTSSQAYLGSFESTDQVRVTVDKEIVEVLLNSLNLEDTTITQKQWDSIWLTIYKSDLVSNFFEGVVEIATNVLEGK